MLGVLILIALLHLCLINERNELLRRATNKITNIIYDMIMPKYVCGGV